MDSITKTTGAPSVNLVDPEGFAVPECERYTPTCPPDPDEELDPADWPAWCDSFYWEPTDPFDIIGPADLAAADAALADLEYPRLAPGLDLPPIRGGAPDEGRQLQTADGSFEPTREDLDWYAAQLDASERRHDWLHQLAAYNDARAAREPWAV